MSDVDLIFAGDLILDVPQPDYWLDGIAPLLRRARVGVAQASCGPTQL